jgi:hypothetical protein
VNNYQTIGTSLSTTHRAIWFIRRMAKRSEQQVEHRWMLAALQLAEQALNEQEVPSTSLYLSIMMHSVHERAFIV